MTDSRNQSAVRRPVVVTAVLLVAVAVLLVALRSWLDRPAGEIDSVAEPSVAAEAEPVEPTPELEPVAEPTEAARPQPELIGVPVAAVAPAALMRVIMLPARVGSSEPAAAAVTEQVHQSALRALRAMPNMNVVEISPAELAGIVPPNAGPLGDDNLVYLAVTSRHEGGVVAEISEQTAAGSPFWSLSVRVRRPSGGGGSSGTISKNGDPRMGNDAESLGVRYAERIARDAARVASESNPVASSNPVAADARGVLLDATRSDEERVRSLAQLLEEGPDSTTIAAAVDLATRSASAQMRLRVWSMLRQRAFDPTLAQPLSYSLLSDVDAAVRKEAAFALSAYAGDAAAASALAHAARNDSSSEVRLAAQMAAMDFDDQQTFKRATLLDRSLTPAERLAPTIVDDNLRSFSLSVGSGTGAMEEILAYAEIVVAVEDPELKIRGLSELQNTIFGGMGRMNGRSAADDSRIVEALIETSRHADGRVRRQAFSALRFVTQMSGNAQGRAALEAVLENEPALAAELNISGTLEELARRQAQDSGAPPPAR